MKPKVGVALILLCLIISSCKKDPKYIDAKPLVFDAKPVSLSVPERFPALSLPANNPLTDRGIELGRKLFFDPILSNDHSMSCGSCHNPSFAFTDNGLALSIGVRGLPGTRNSMPIQNLAWDTAFAWDGFHRGLQNQATEPIQNPLELDLKLSHLVNRLQKHPSYPAMFYAAFGSENITIEGVTKALEQFELSLISANSQLDRFLRGEPGQSLSDSALMGLELFRGEVLVDGGGNRIGGGADCWHCHSITGADISPEIDNLLFTDNGFHNNGLDLVPDSGKARWTRNPADLGKFKTPSLRNVALTGPYMHDGRFETLDEVLDFYSTGIINGPTADALIKTAGVGGYNFSADEKIALIEFLKTLTDESFVSNPAFQAP